MNVYPYNIGFGFSSYTIYEYVRKEKCHEDRWRKERDNKIILIFFYIHFFYDADDLQRLVLFYIKNTQGS